MLRGQISFGAVGKLLAAQRLLVTLRLQIPAFAPINGSSLGFPGPLPSLGKFGGLRQRWEAHLRTQKCSGADSEHATNSRFVMTGSGVRIPLAAPAVFAELATP